MKNKFKSAFIIDLDEDNLSKTPVLLGVVLVYIATLFLQSMDKLHLHTAIIFTIVMIIHAAMYWFDKNIFKHKHWLYFIIQGIIIFDCAVIMPSGYVTIFLGLIPVLVLQSMIIYYDAIKVIITAVFYYSIFCGTILIHDGTKELLRYLPMLVFLTITIRVFSMFFFRQVKLRVQTQKNLQKLELAYEKVEELTLINERQRVARDLHDTLSQGLAGIILQLDAANANLNNNNVQRAKEIIQKSMDHARKTLADSRLVINDLRYQNNINIDFVKSVEKEIEHFKNVSDTSVKMNIIIESAINVNVLKHILYIVREALNNIARHAEAENVIVKIIENENQININIVDDGIGFDVKILDTLIGHYGIIGITERVKAINGDIKIESKKKRGTNINIAIPIVKGIFDENE